MRKSTPTTVVASLGLLLSALALASCSSSDVPEEQLVKKDELTYWIDSGELFTGSSVKFHSDGKLENRKRFKNGVREGQSEWFWENGELGQIGSFKDGKKEGRFKMHNDDGSLQRVVDYKNNVKVE